MNAKKTSKPEKVQKNYITSEIIGLKELREHTEKYVRAIEGGSSFTVMRRSKPIFRLIPIDEWAEGGATEKTVADFRSITSKGIPITEVINALKRLNA